jgi:hypothetical protein
MRVTTDKIESGYMARYDERFTNLNPTAVLELGVLNGDSLNEWRARWPDAFIAGVDLNWPDIIGDWAFFKAAQDDHHALTLISEHGPWTLIIDDAEHVGIKSAASFDTLWPHVAPGGCYVIEDWGTGYWPGWADYGHDLNMVTLAKSLIDQITGNGNSIDIGIERIEYCPGQIFIWKAP